MTVNPLSQMIITRLAERRGLVVMRIEDHTVYVAPEEHDAPPKVTQLAMDVLAGELNRGNPPQRTEVKLA